MKIGNIMCLALPYKIISTNGRQAKVFCPAEKIQTLLKSVSLELIPDLKIGDFILVQNNTAVKKIPEKEAAEIFKMLQ